MGACGELQAFMIARRDCTWDSKGEAIGQYDYRPKSSDKLNLFSYNFDFGSDEYASLP